MTKIGLLGLKRPLKLGDNSGTEIFRFKSFKFAGDVIGFIKGINQTLVSDNILKHQPRLNRSQNFNFLFFVGRNNEDEGNTPELLSALNREKQIPNYNL